MTIFEIMTFLFIVGLLAAVVLENHYQQAIQNKVTIYAVNGLRPCLNKIENSYRHGSTDLISKAVTSCIRIQNDLFKVSEVNVNGVVTMQLSESFLNTKKIKLVPLFGNDVAQISSGRERVVNRWRCDTEEDKKISREIAVESFCVRLNTI